jgi:hypothetical protein
MGCGAQRLNRIFAECRASRQQRRPGSPDQHCHGTGRRSGSHGGRLGFSRACADSCESSADRILPTRKPGRSGQPISSTHGVWAASATKTTARRPDTFRASCQATKIWTTTATGGLIRVRHGLGAGRGRRLGAVHRARHLALHRQVPFLNVRTRQIAACIKLNASRWLV